MLHDTAAVQSGPSAGCRPPGGQPNATLLGSRAASLGSPDGRELLSRLGTIQSDAAAVKHRFTNLTGLKNDKEHLCLWCCSRRRLQRS